MKKELLTPEIFKKNYSEYIGTKILIIDDLKENYEFYELILSTYGFSNEIATDYQIGLKKVQIFKPDLILIDYYLPDKGCWKFIKKLKIGPEFSQYKRIPVIVIAAWISDEEKKKNIDLGIASHFTAPIMSYRLVECIISQLKQP